MSDKVKCPGCGSKVSVTKGGRYWKHGGGDCDFSGTLIPTDDKDNESCRSDSASSAPSQTATSAESPTDAVKEPAEPATSSTPSSPPSKGEAEDASMTAPADDALPGATEYITALGALAEEQQAAHKAAVDSKLLGPPCQLCEDRSTCLVCGPDAWRRFSQPVPDVEYPTLFSQPVPLDDEEVRAPTPSSFSQPAGRTSEQPAEPMTDLGKELTARLKEMFYAYDNRRTSDNRSAQVTMGPSEMGTPCDRRLALSLMRMPAVNPGGDGWAAFVGTCIHEGLADMFLWANAGTGRFAVETRLEFDSEVVPKGTADLIDRVLFMLDDHKCQGRWSRNKLKSQGPIPTYRVQAHVYAHGARKRGEQIEHVAIISWPRDESTLDDLYVWTEPYNPLIVQKAFERVERIAKETEEKQAALIEEYKVPATEEHQLIQIKARTGADYDVKDDCRFCPFYMPSARNMTQGCNGKR